MQSPFARRLCHRTHRFEEEADASTVNHRLGGPRVISANRSHGPERLRENHLDESSSLMEINERGVFDRVETKTGCRVEGSRNDASTDANFSPEAIRVDAVRKANRGEGRYLGERVDDVER